MFNIDKYLQKFSKGISTLELNKKKIIEIINKHTNLSVDANTIEIKDYKIIVDTTRVGKNQLFLKKSKILEEVKQAVGVTIVDIC